MQDEWTEKHRPKSLSEIVGNDPAVRAIRRWAENWKRGAPRLKALVLRGEPGVGKTSAALALARDMGWDFIEMNASDHRNAASIKKVAGAGSANQTFSPDGDFLSSSEGKRKLVILDEADNLFGRSDYGGAKAIVETIRESRQPIILIVNDYYELTRRAPAIKTLAEKAVFRRLDSGSMIALLKSIAYRERVTVDENVLRRIAENCGGDMRAAVNDLQMMVEGKDHIDISDSEAMGKRNQLKEVDESLRAMFGAKTVKQARDETLDLDKTPDELEKWIEENIPLEMRHSADMAAAFDALSKSDIFLGWTKRSQDYAMWAYAKELMTGGVAVSRTHGPRPEVSEYRFPSHFILMSRAKGPRAVRDSLATKLQGQLHASKKCIIDSVIPLLSLTIRNDEELLVRLGTDLKFDEEDVAFLLGVEPDSKATHEVMAKIKGEQQASEGQSSGGKKRVRSQEDRSSLKDF